MRFFKKLLNIFIHPRLWLLIPIAFIAVVSVVLATLFMTQTVAGHELLGYIFLGIMVVSISYTVYGAIKVWPSIQEWAMGRAQSWPFWNRLFTEYGFRTIIFLIGSFAINIAFAVYNGTIALIARSIWFGALSAYYIGLILLRGGILMYHSRRRKAIKYGQTEDVTFFCDTKVYGRCGILLVLLPVALSFAILQMVREGDAFVHTGVTIYVYAIYAFYKISMAIYNIVRTRQTSEMTVKASRNIGFADAMVSILALQTAMFREFGEGMLDFAATMNAATGGVVCALTAALGIYMIFKTHIIKRDIK